MRSMLYQINAWRVKTVYECACTQAKQGKLVDCKATAPRWYYVFQKTEISHLEEMLANFNSYVSGIVRQTTKQDFSFISPRNLLCPYFKIINMLLIGMDLYKYKELFKDPKCFPKYLGNMDITEHCFLCITSMSTYILSLSLNSTHHVERFQNNWHFCFLLVFFKVYEIL